MNEEPSVTELTPFEQDMDKDRETFMTLLKLMLTPKEIELLDAYIGDIEYAAGMVAQLVAMQLRHRECEALGV